MSADMDNSTIFCIDGDTNSHGHDFSSYLEETPLIQFEFLSDTPLTAANLCADKSLGLHEDEPDSWAPCVSKEIIHTLSEKEVKRQEHIYEFIMTEKRHCITLLVMQKIFVDGLLKHFHLVEGLEKMFPRLSDLTELHLEFLARLRQRQRENIIVSSIADILVETFSNTHAIRLKSAYGEFCSNHRNAVETYKHYLLSDSKFKDFVIYCQSNPLLKKKGIPECILFVTQRLTKYPLLIEPLIKTSKDNKSEQEILHKALALVKDILIEVDAQVAKKEMEERKLEMYNKIDDKSITVYRGNKFRKSDILQGNRTLKFEGVATLMQGTSKMQPVVVIVMSDFVFFLQDNSNKYTFFIPASRTGVLSLKKLLVREVAGPDSNGIYLISTDPAEPEMFELKVHKPRDKQMWIRAIREAVSAKQNQSRQTIEKQQLPLHLANGINHKKIHQDYHMKQQIPLKLANKLGGEVSKPNVGVVEQIFPIRLKKDPEVQRSNTTSYQRLGSTPEMTEQIHFKKQDDTKELEQLYNKMEISFQKSLMGNVQVTTDITEDNTKENAREKNCKIDSSFRENITSRVTRGSSLRYSSSTVGRRKGNMDLKQQLPLHLISATNQRKLSQHVHTKQQIPFQIASKSTRDPLRPNDEEIQQKLPLSLRQDDKIRRTNMSGYERLNNSFSLPFGKTTSTTNPYTYSTQDSHPVLMQASSLNLVSSNNNLGRMKATRTHTYPKLSDKYKVRKDQQPSTDEEVIYV